MGIFRAYDIRGLYPDEIDEKMALRIGKAYATHTRYRTVAVGCDARLSSPAIKAALINGLMSCGVSVFDVGMVTTPMLYFSRAFFECDGALMVTASHNPPQYNGIKMCKGEFVLPPEEIQMLVRLISEGVYRSGKGVVSRRNVLVPYLKFLNDGVKIERKQKIVIDGGNGTAGPVAVKLFKALGCDVVSIYCEPDGNFPGHLPDPTVLENIEDLKSKVVVLNADLGIAYDGDGDRVVFVDERGTELSCDEALALLAREVLYKYHGATVLCDVKCSKLLMDDVRKHGGKPVIYRTGHTFIRRKMLEDMIPIAGEASGHVYYNDVGYDDGIFASLKMVELLSLNTHKKLSGLRDSLPKYVSTPNIKVECDDDEKFEIVAKIQKDFAKEEYDVVTIDGARVDFGYGWGLVRASNTEPVLSLRFEARTQKQLDGIKEIFVEKLEKYHLQF
ncbi:MAG: phosphomannomutase [Candidatus Nanohalarchaeota archaeon]|nr:MAG: phosphomannomutase [Candidatus Nanohaloarchaeota archaeon]